MFRTEMIEEAREILGVARVVAAREAVRHPAAAAEGHQDDAIAGAPERRDDPTCRTRAARSLQTMQHDDDRPVAVEPFQAQEVSVGHLQHVIAQNEPATGTQRRVGQDRLKVTVAEPPRRSERAWTYLARGVHLRPFRASGGSRPYGCEVGRQAGRATRAPRLALYGVPKKKQAPRGAGGQHMDRLRGPSKGDAALVTHRNSVAALTIISIDSYVNWCGVGE